MVGFELGGGCAYTVKGAKQAGREPGWAALSESWADPIRPDIYIVYTLFYIEIMLESVYSRVPG